MQTKAKLLGPDWMKDTPMPVKDLGAVSETSPVDADFVTPITSKRDLLLQLRFWISRDKLVLTSEQQLKTEAAVGNA